MLLRMIDHQASRLKIIVHTLFIFFGLIILLNGCSAIMTSATNDMMSHLSKTILNNDDPALVESGAPAYLLFIDSLISKDPENETTLTSAALLYSAYADLFIKDNSRARKMAAKSLDYATRAVCLARESGCDLRTSDYETFETRLTRFDRKNIDPLFALGNAWAGWIMINRNDFNAIADLSRIEAIMKKIIELDDTYKNGAPYLYLGSLSSFLPPALGGRPEDGKKYFEKAIELSKNKNLSAQVAYARYYARMVYDRKLHDRLLSQVLKSDPYVEGFTLFNIWAQKQAEDLLATAEDYF